MNKLFLFLLLLTCSCTTMSVFGGKVTSEYKEHYKGELECAMVEGWFSSEKCMCHITDESFSPHAKTFLDAPSAFCEEEYQ